MINQFIGHVKKFGVSRVNKFAVTIPFPESLINNMSGANGLAGSLISQFDPTGLAQSATDMLGLTNGRGPLNLSRQLSLVCIGVSYPGWSTTTQDASFLGFHDQIVVDSNSDDVEFLFLVSGDGVEQSIFDQWTDMIQDHKTGKVGYYDDYVTERIRIESRDPSGDRQHFTDLMECYPTSVNPVDLDRTTDSATIALSVTFSFKYIRPKGSTSLMESLAETSIGGVVTDIVEGNFTSAAQKAVGIVSAVQDGQYVGEALGAFGMINTAVSSIGIDPDYAKKALGTIKVDIGGNGRISGSDKNSLSGIIDNVTNLL